MATVPAKTVTQKDKLYTSEEFMSLSLDPAYRYELVRGLIQKMSQPGEEHALVQDNLYAELRTYVRAKQLGRVLPSTSFDLPIDPARDTVRAPDLIFIIFIAASKVSGQSGAITAVPDLAVEVYSSNDRPGEYVRKFEDYRAAGWDMLWLIYPPNSVPKYKAGTVEIYHVQQSLTPAQTLKQSDQLQGEGVLKGFRMPVAAVFDYDGLITCPHPCRSAYAKLSIPAPFLPEKGLFLSLSLLTNPTKRADSASKFSFVAASFDQPPIL